MMSFQCLFTSYVDYHNLKDTDVALFKIIVLLIVKIINPKEKKLEFYDDRQPKKKKKCNFLFRYMYFDGQET